ncbi:hypothetical protein J8V57_11035 [Xenorhabdus sp. PB61.4]|nr:hypothetical protein [Xenorhabdus sp. PB61.4]MCC8366811.1 hypothetical protein [Xenorhabdus sp. PB61.4]
MVDITIYHNPACSALRNTLELICNSVLLTCGRTLESRSALQKYQST